MSPDFVVPEMTADMESLARAIAPHLSGLRGLELREQLADDVRKANDIEICMLPDLWSKPGVRHVLDLGAGYGRGCVLARRAWPDADIVAYDGDGTSSPYDELCPRGDTYYGNLDAMRAFLNANDCDADIIDARRTMLAELGTFDVILSFYSVGYHWRLDDFAGDLAALSRPGTMLALHTPSSGKPPRLDGWSTSDRRPSFPHVSLWTMTRTS